MNIFPIRYIAQIKKFKSKEGNKSSRNIHFLNHNIKNKAVKTMMVFKKQQNTKSWVGISPEKEWK